MLQELYSLSTLYEIVPGLRGAGDEILILLDELDQGWDNTPHSNRFIASLLQAAIKIQTLGLRAHVIAFLRSEIFDLVKGQLDQLDKLRSSIEVIKWSDGELAYLIVRRIGYKLGTPDQRTGHDLEIVNSLFEGSFRGMDGFGYLLSRTSLRPREVLQFVRHAHRLAVDSGQNCIAQDALQKTEEDFSSWKLEHLCSEYRHIYPGLKELLWAFRSEGPMLIESDIEILFEQYKKELSDKQPEWSRISLTELLQLLFTIEFIGVPRPQAVKNRAGILSQYEFAYERQAANVRSATSFLIHPAFWAVLEIGSA